MNWWKAFLSAVLFGVATPISKRLLSEIHPFMLAGLFYLGAALILLPQSILLQKSIPLKSFSKSDTFNLLGSLFFGGMVGPVLLLLGLQLTEATNGSLLLNLETPATAILAYLFFKENMSRRATLATIGILLSCIILTFQGTFSPGLGGILIALACLAWGLDNNFTASIHSIEPIRCTFLKGITFGAVNFLISLFLVHNVPSIKAVFIALVVGAFSYGISIVLYISAARGIGATRSQMVFASAPFFGVAVSQIWIGESFHYYQIVSCFVMISALVLLFTEKHIHFHSHELMVHIHRHSHNDSHHDHDHEEPIDNNLIHTHEHRHKSEIHEHCHWPDFHHRHDH